MVVYQKLIFRKKKCVEKKNAFKRIFFSDRFYALNVRVMSGGFDLKIGGVEGFQGGFQTPPVFFCPENRRGGGVFWRGVLVSNHN